jgi:hypothetical protein
MRSRWELEPFSAGVPKLQKLDSFQVLSPSLCHTTSNLTLVHWQTWGRAMDLAGAPPRSASCLAAPRPWPRWSSIS